MDGAVLSVQGLSVELRVDRAGVPIIDDISFAISPGKVLALVGESGSGKSVTALSILGLLAREIRVSAGRILFNPDGAAPIDLAALPVDGPEIRRIRGNRAAMVFQEPMSSFSPLHTIGSQIADVLKLHQGLNAKAARAEVAGLLDRVGIADPGRAVGRYPHEFSGGMRQRAMIAKALACRPALLIADEPTTALDVTIQAQILQLMRNLQAEYRMAILFITHDLGIVAQMADEVAIMYTGRIVERGPVRAVFRHPLHPYTANLLKTVPRLGELTAWRKLEPIRGAVPNLFDMPAGCTFHPRCEARIAERCDRQSPRPRALPTGREVSCHLHDAGGAP